ncbi:cysteine-rich DPF motif domain-containing protein 1-like [Diadema antillarum]|uniref:cysteine-rich DPF motif domain-containing protein 1-like n=1 Tax=Diadema antillarum TaxID=105358 RepID=UPI003A838621
MEQNSEEKRGVFECSLCSFTCPYDYYGRKPGFLKSIVLLEEAYVMRDPFTPENRHLTVGGSCSVCNRTVCVGKDCSVFYTRRFCVDCVMKNLEEFPKEICQEFSKKDKG